MRTTVLICLLGAGSAQATSLATFEYDEVGRLLHERAADGRVVASYTYDLVGNRTSVTDALGNRTTYVHDAFDRVVETIDAVGGRTHMAYDAGNRITQITDPRGLKTSYLVDGFSRLLRETSPDRGTTTYAHDSAGQVTRMTRANGTWLDYEYDPLGRVIAEGNEAEQRRFAYDTCLNGKGRLCSGDVGDDHSRMEYGRHGELTARHERIEGQGFSTHYFRDGAGRLTGLQYPDGMQVDYAYEGGELRSIHAEVGGQVRPVVTQIRYAPFDGIESWVYGNGLTRTYTRDAEGRLTGIGVSHATGVRQSLTYQYDAAGRITRITNGVDGSQTQSYQYDGLSRLTSAVSANRSQAFMHDANGNRTWASEGGAGGAYAIASSSNRLLAVEGRQYGYDEVGNRVLQDDGSAQLVYHYDAFNRLELVEKSDGGRVRMQTNAFDQRALKEGESDKRRFVFRSEEHTSAL
jgi:YD repeat-containing protein